MISRIIDRAIAGVEQDARTQQSNYVSRFFNPLRFDPTGGRQPIPVPWDGLTRRAAAEA
jgi:hypothetical protein